MVPVLKVVLDLGDVFTKGHAEGASGSARFRYPSAVAHRLLDEHESTRDQLIADTRSPLQRSADFDPRQFPRARSYPGAAAFQRAAWRNHGRPVPGARFAGWLAAAHGADRQVLGSHPSDDNVDALVRKALLLHATSEQRAEVHLIVDLGLKAGAIQRYAQVSPRRVLFRAHSFERKQPREVRLSAHLHLLDAPACAVAALPDELRADRLGRVLLVDIGYGRTKLALWSRAGCEHQQVLEDLGAADCVRRVLRDGQDRALVEDEYAVMHALEQSLEAIEVAGRHFDIRRPMRTAAEEASVALARAIERVLGEQYARSGELCRAVVILGGGAYLLGGSLLRRLESLPLSLERKVSLTDPYVLVSGARRLVQAQTSAG